MEKKALVVISFGTTYPAALAAIEAIEQHLHSALPEYDLYRAFTSGMVIRKLEREQQVRVKTPQELLCSLAEQGYTELLCQTTHILNGLEYDKMCAQLTAQAHRFQSLRVGKPLLSSEQDYAKCCHAVLRMTPPLAPEEALVLMGHGTTHFANSAYSQLENTFRFLGQERIWVGTVEGFPALDYVLGRLRQQPVKRVRLLPFLIVAGDHAQNDLAGAGETSWKSILLRAGYEVEVHLQGLGTSPEICALFLEHLRQAQSLQHTGDFHCH